MPFGTRFKSGLTPTRDGITDSGELHSLSSLSIESVDLNYTSTNLLLTGGSNLFRTASFTKTDTSTGTIGSLWFAWDEINARYNQSFDLDLRALFLPTLREEIKIPMAA